jgi:hypothetical protein
MQAGEQKFRGFLKSSESTLERAKPLRLAGSFQPQDWTLNKIKMPHYFCSLA